MSDYCHKHKSSPQDENWQVAFQELVSGDEPIEPFSGQVCPLCFLSLREKQKKNKRQLKVESLKAIRLQTEVAKLQEVINAVVDVVKLETGKDATELVGKVFPQPCRRGGTVLGPINQEEVGKLERILPNLIVEAIHGKSQNPAKPVQ